jgi:hypothetical protein
MTAGIAAIVVSLSACNSSKKSSAEATAAAIAAAESQAQSAASQAQSAASSAMSAPASADSQPAAASSPAPGDSSPVAADSPAAAGSVAAGSINVCSLLSVSKAEAITGNKYSSSTDNTPDPGDQNCVYDGADNGSDLLVYLFTPSNETTWDNEVAASTVGSSASVVNVPGVGKRAISSGINFLFDTGKYYIDIQFADESGDKNAIALAKQILTAPGAA